ncbi:MAG: hypothetical protein AABZ31_06355, partial [Bdellovibrionota bacterium]
ELELRIEMGQSVRSSLIYLLGRTQTEFSFLVQELLLAADQLRSPQNVFAKAASCYQRSLLQLIWRGLQGEPILSGLRMLKIEMDTASRVELELYMSRLPLLALIPLLLFLLPSFMLLLFGPILSLLSQGMFQ